MDTDSHILALDQGTTSSRTVVLDRHSRIVAMAQQEFRQIYPRPGWVEHDPLEIWSSQRGTITRALEKAGITAAAIAAVGITNQRETTVVWDRETGKPVYNAIVWQDRRTADLCARLTREGAGEMVSRKTGLRLDPYFSATKIRWILDHVAGARQRAQAGKLLFGTVDSWLVWLLTAGKVHVTDVSNASRTLLLNIHTGNWDDELLELLGVPRAMLPEVRGSSEVYGRVASGHAPAGKPVAGIAGDQQAALFGQACFQPGMAKNTYGTGCFLLMNTGERPVPSHNNLLTTIAWKVAGRTEYALEGSVFVGGAVIQWLRDELQMIRSAEEIDEIAASVPDAHGMFLVPAFAGLGAPHWDPYARGLAVGMTRGTNRAHFCRAALESIALQSADLIACMEKDSGLQLQELRVDGGASRSEPLMQFQADLLGTPVVRPKNTESTATGAAYLAGLAVGFWPGRDAITQCWEQDRVFHRQRDAADIQRLRHGWNRAVQLARQWAGDD